MSKRALIAIIVGIIVAATAAGIVAVTTGEQRDDITEGDDIQDGRQLALDLNENLSLKGNP